MSSLQALREARTPTPLRARFARREPAPFTNEDCYAVFEACKKLLTEITVPDADAIHVAYYLRAKVVTRSGCNDIARSEPMLRMALRAVREFRGSR